MNSNKVYIVGGTAQYINMFTSNNWEVVAEPSEADLIQFTGGEDVTPSYYLEVAHPKTSNNPHRDAIEAEIFLRHCSTPMAGICRGAQFLNVMCGGSLYQDVDNHAIYETHLATLTKSGGEIQVSSTHHQMMIPSEEAEILMVANQSTCRAINDSEFDIKPNHVDVEACFYKEDKVLCYQPHPEFYKEGHKCQETYFEFIDYLLKESKGK